jgi:hypothetical protein
MFSDIPIRPLHAHWRNAVLASGKTSQPQVSPDPDPVQFVTRQLGIQPDPNQQWLLTGPHHRLIVNCSRQWGKSTITAAKVLHTALTRPEILVLVTSRTARQSGLFINKVAAFARRLGIRPRRDPASPISVLLPNQSSIVGLPGSSGENIRGFSSAALLVIDEAARVSDDLYYTARPSLAASRGDIWLLSTPRGKRGFFYNEWAHHQHRWERLSVPATQCPRIPSDFLEEERSTMGEDWFRQEYMCEFIDLNGTIFVRDLVEKAFTSEILPLTLELTAGHTPLAPRGASYHIGLDLGQKHDFTAIAILERRDAGLPHFLHPWAVEETAYQLRYLERLPLGTPYPKIVEHIAALTRRPELQLHTELVVDGTGVGAPVVDLLRQAALPCRITSLSITAGEHAHQTHRSAAVPKRDLIATLEVMLDEEELKIAAALPERRRLVEEFMSLKAGTTRTGHETFGAAGSNHDDLLIAVALACWSAKRPLAGHQSKRLL